MKTDLLSEMVRASKCVAATSAVAAAHGVAHVPLFNATVVR
jgi:hypothetical protein